MKFLFLVLVVIVGLLLPTSASAYLGSPYTNNDGALQNESVWYGAHCGPVMVEYYYIGSGKWRHLFIVCKNDPSFYDACAAAYWWKSNQGIWYLIQCGRAPRYQDTWCDNGNGSRIRGRDLYHTWERVSSVPCVKP